jgi:hypothetical protein
VILKNTFIRILHVSQLFFEIYYFLDLRQSVERQVQAEVSPEGPLGQEELQVRTVSGPVQGTRKSEKTFEKIPQRRFQP